LKKSKSDSFQNNQGGKRDNKRRERQRCLRKCGIWFQDPGNCLHDGMYDIQ
jgi:hypothetical protein